MLGYAVVFEIVVGGVVVVAFDARAGAVICAVLEGGKGLMIVRSHDRACETATEADFQVSRVDCRVVNLADGEFRIITRLFTEGLFIDYDGVFSVAYLDAELILHALICGEYCIAVEFDRISLVDVLNLGIDSFRRRSADDGRNKREALLRTARTLPNLCRTTPNVICVVGRRRK